MRLRLIFAKVLRQLESITFEINNILIKSWLFAKYPRIIIDKKSKIERGCKIVCVDGGALKICNSFISKGTQIFVDDNGSVDLDNCFIGRNCVIASKKSIIIGYGTMVAEMVVIRDQNHILDLSNLSDPFLNYDQDDINIGKRCWLAAKCTILKGVNIGNYSIVGASAVVNKNIPDFEIWAGIPAKMIKRLK